MVDATHFKCYVFPIILGKLSSLRLLGAAAGPLSEVYWVSPGNAFLPLGYTVSPLLFWQCKTEEQQQTSVH